MNVQGGKDFLKVNNLVELSQKLMKTNKHNVYILVYKLLKIRLVIVGSNYKC
jgi:hypothetical protein